MTDYRVLIFEVILMLAGAASMRQAWMNRKDTPELENSKWFFVGLVMFVVGAVGIWFAWVTVGR